MKFPFTSFAMAIVIWGFCVVVFFYIALQKSPVIPATLEVDASIVDELSRQAEKSDSREKNLAEKSVQKIAQEEELEKVIAEKQRKKNSPNSGDSKPDKIATITARPLPEIPEELRQDAFNSYAIARFNIAADGSAAVELIKPCNNPRLNQLLLQSLRKWKFAPASALGVAVASTQDVKVNFKVE